MVSGSEENSGGLEEEGGCDQSQNLKRVLCFVENMVHYLSELGMVHLDTTLFYLSLWAAATIYTVRCCLDKSPPWTDALELVAAEIFFVKLNHQVIRQSRIRRRNLAKTTNTSVDDDDDETQE
ncbi:hypothetical protein ARALYDRAFT_917135 [Arabidopsis lyrata subsp. lyrata]|uniref:Cyclin C-terminal domain-containing protein n=1 Tax=Arabidopsis lyrata subsp. lyrata TaxID=81972 RepID=D7MLL1_ARALL|nr:hypothetical protein ARALYDRAFT_917135 [Arabidopsis lyrata subsp. lyrata]